MPTSPPRILSYRRPLAIAAALFVAYLLLGYLAGPPLVRHILTKSVAEALKRKVSVGEARINPLALSIELKDLSLDEDDGAPIAGIRRLYANFQLSSLVRRAWTFADITLEGLEVHADIAPSGRLNLLALLDDLPKSEKKEGSGLPRVLLQRVKLSDGAFVFSDRAIPTPARATLAPINLEFEELSTLPDREGHYSLSVRLLAGGTISWRGVATAQPLASQGELSMKGIKPLTLWRFVAYRMPDVVEPQGEYDATARYRLSYSQGTLQLVAENLNANGRGIALAAGGDKGVALALASLEIAGARAELSLAQGKPWQAKLSLPKVVVAGVDYLDRSRSPALRATAKEATLGMQTALEQRGDDVQVVLRDATANLDALAGGEPNAAKPYLALDTLALDVSALDLLERRLELKRVAVTGGELIVTRQQDGSLPLLGFVKAPSEGLIKRQVGGALQAARQEGKPWRVALDALQVEGTRVALSDLSFGEPIAYDVRDLRASLAGYASDGEKPVKFDAALRLEQGGALAASGEATPSGDRADFSAKLERLSLKPLAAALGRNTQLALDSGEVSASVKGSYRAARGKPAVRAAGAVRLDNLALRGRDSGEKLLGWKSLAASGVKLSLSPDLLGIEDVKLEGVRAKIVVEKDRSLNLIKALAARAGDASAPPATATAAPATTATTGDAEPPIPVAVERLRFVDGEVDFADLSLVLPFAATVNQLEGLVQGIGSDRASRAAVRLEGRVDEYGLARAEGSLSPFRPKSFLDLAVTFRNVDMPPLSPYSATFAGRRISSGRLSLDLNYKINDGKLAGDNRVLLQDFTLGEKVESPSALNLPLDLAIALLTDADGKIDLSVPVTGDVDDPQFGYGTVIWQAIKTVIGNIVSAPFRALASIFGGGGEQLGAIAFDPGRATLLPPEQEKLKRVADGLAKRPQVRLVAEGQTGAADRAALQRRDVALAVAAKLGRAPAGGAEPDPVNVTDAKTQRALEAIYEERNSAEALDKFAADTGKARGKEVDRVNAALALIGRASADGAFYEALLRRMNETARVTDDALAQLAALRAQAVVDHLTKALSLPAERVGTRTAKAQGEALAKLELEVAEKKQ